LTLQEINLDPLEFVGDCFSRMERQLNGLLAKVRGPARGSSSTLS
jgi:hypothetical protein